MTATDDDIKALEEALAKAFPRPWVTWEYNDGESLAIHYGEDWRICFMATPGDSPGAAEMIDASATAIVAAVNLAPTLIARLRAAEAERDAHTNPFWAVSYLYVHGYLTDRERDACRKRILSRIQKEGGAVKAASWGAIYNRFLRRGHDHGSAAFGADQWEKRQNRQRWKHCPSTHCERRRECASPNECAARIQKEASDEG